MNEEKCWQGVSEPVSTCRRGCWRRRCWRRPWSAAPRPARTRRAASWSWRRCGFAPAPHLHRLLLHLAAPSPHLLLPLACSYTSPTSTPRLGGELHGGAEAVLHPAQLPAGLPHRLRDGGGVAWLPHLQVLLLPPLKPALRRRREAQPAGRRRRESLDSGRRRRQAPEGGDPEEVRRGYEAEVAGDILLPSEDELREVSGQPMSNVKWKSLFSGFDLACLTVASDPGEAH